MKIEELRATLTPEEFNVMTAVALRNLYARTPDKVAGMLPAIVEEMRREGFTEEAIAEGVQAVAESLRTNNRRGQG